MKCASSKESIERIHYEAKNSNLALDQYYFTTFIDKLMQYGSTEEAEATLMWMRQQQMQSNVITYNAMINGYSERSNYTRARELFEEMKAQGIKPVMVMTVKLLLPH